MRAGKLDRRTTFYTVDEETDAETSFVTVWGAIEPLNAREIFAARQAQSEVTGRIRIRYRTDIDPTMRAGVGSRRWEIEGIVDPEDRHEELHVLVKETKR